MRSETLVNDSVEHLFRRNAGQMTAVLTRIFGLGKIDLIEDAIQEALIKALNGWKIRGIPENPKAWLIQVAKNSLLDRLRKDNKSVSFDRESKLIDDYAMRADAEEGVFFEKEIREDQLQMIFACCHPSIPPDSQIALTLKTVGGFSTKEIARAFLGKKEAVAKMLVRAKKKLREENVRLEIPAPAEVTERIEPVLKVLYLMFNEGYTASEGEDLVRKDLCYEAIRLAKLLTGHPLTSLPKVHALAALFLFQASRLPARRSSDGTLSVLPEQDRRLWDREMIGEGLRHFRASASGSELSDFHLEAEIASYYVLAESAEATNWTGLLRAYDELASRSDSPIVALNRVLAFAEVNGAESALAELEKIPDDKLSSYYPYHITLAELQARIGDAGSAARSYGKARDLTENETVKTFLTGKIGELEKGAAGTAPSNASQF